MFWYKNNVHLGIEIEFIKGKFVFLLVWELDFVKIINVGDQVLFFSKVRIFFAESEKVRSFLCH